MINAQYNWRLRLGFSIILVVILATLFAPLLTSYTPDSLRKFDMEVTDKGAKITEPLTPPTEDHWLGTTPHGHDLFTLILYGGRITIFLVFVIVLTRMISGVALGFWLGTSRWGKRFIEPLELLSSMPAIVILYCLLISISRIPSIPIWQLLLLQGGLIALFGIPAIATVTAKKTSLINKNPSVVASRVLGANPLWIIRKHIAPALKENLVILTLQEMIVLLNLIGQLGVFNIFFGGTKSISLDSQVVQIPRIPEWGGLISAYREQISFQPWVPFFPILAFAIVMFALFLLSRGFEIRYEKRYKETPHI
ncbi:peptide/nickel transport system permease protein [Marininema mesophilum]|uniref:Peptide/nickel transport system permease protein n=1 Tax=Marininema mesophilum TaxID=1048340 RepID=A0A1H2Z072_9BACL|nr:ABC transporter permease subunit [Marininema mesophilum]SDX10820.1 peptide/nickel transport system permease protein [Marininema mesophilum]